MEISFIRAPLKSLALVLLWVLFAWAYFQHLPLPNPLVRLIVMALAGGVVALSAFGWGHAIVGHFLDDQATVLEAALFSVAAGFGAISFLMILLGTVNLWTVRGALVLLMIGVALSLPAVREWPGRWTLACEAPLPQGLIIAAAILSFLLAFAPPTYYDSLVYHYALPSMYIHAHHWLGLQYLIYSAFPQTLELLWAYGFLLAHETLANVIGWSLSAALVAAVFSFGRRYFNPRTAWWAAALLAVMPATLLLSSGGYVDIGLALFTFLSFYALCLWMERPAAGSLILAGLLAGWAIGVKYTGGISFGIGLLFVLWNSRRSGFAALSKNLLLFVLPALAVMTPWLVKNAHYTGNPVFPFFYQWGSATLSPWVGRAAAGYFSGLSEYQPRAFWNLPLLLWEAAVRGLRFGGGMDVLGDFGWAPIFALLPALGLITPQKKVVRWLGAYAILFFIPWGMSRPVLRFLIPAAPVFCLLAAEAWWQGAEQAGPLLQRVVRSLLAVWIVSGFFIFFYVSGLLSSYSVVLGLEDREAYLTRKLDYYGAATFVNQLPEASLTYVVGDQRGYYYNKPVIVTPVFNANPLTGWANDAKDPAALASLLKSKGITHLLVNYAEMRRLSASYPIFPFSEHGRDNWDALLLKNAHSLYKDRACEVFAL